MQGLGEAALGGNPGGVSLHPLGQRLEGRVLGREDRRCVGASIHFLAADGGDEVRTLRKVTIEGAHTHAGALGDLPNGGVDTGRGEHRFRRRKQGFEIALRIGTLTALTRLPTLRTIGPI